MQPSLKVLDRGEDVLGLIDYVREFEYVAYDCETTGVQIGTEVIGYSICCEDNTAYYVILQRWDPVEKKMVMTDCHDASVKLIASLTDKKLIMHNAIFDCRVTEDYFHITLINSLHTDTMVLAHLLDENRRIGLKELGKSLFGEDAAEEQKLMKESVLNNGGSLTKSSYEMYKADAHIMGKYGAKDAWLTYKLFLELVPQLIDQGLDKFFYDDESMPLLKGPTYELNKTGLRVDNKALLKLKNELIAECAKDKAFIESEIKSFVAEVYPGTNKKNTFNFGSNQQLSWLLFEKLDQPFTALTDKGKKVCKDILNLSLPYTRAAQRAFITGCKTSQDKKLQNPHKFIKVDNKTLSVFVNRYEWVKRLLSYKKKLKILNTYVEGIEEKIQYGIIYPSFLQTGTTSGRYSSRNPNFQNLPRDDKSVKACIVSRPGKVFVGADYSQLEPRVFAYFSNDERLLASFNSEDDFYSVIGMEVWNKTDCVPRKDGSPDAFGIKYKNLRNLAKVIALASTYGATANKLSATTGKNVEDTQLDIDNYFESFPGVKEMMLKSHEEAKTHGQVKNLFGRPRRMPEAKKIYKKASHDELPYDQRNLLNLAVNHRIQSTGASIVNRAAIMFNNNCKLAGIEAKLVLQVHDSLVAECSEKDADDIVTLLQDAMENAVKLPGIKLEAIPKIGKNLSEV
jgi:DNA polymerase-1